MDQDLSGTWLLTQYDEWYDKATNTYLYTSIGEQSIVIQDDPVAGLLVYECWDIAGVGDSAYKTDSHFYMNSNLDDFVFVGPDVMESATRDGIEYSWPPGSITYTHFRIEKLSNGVDVDKGHLIVNGPITVSETNTACVRHGTNDSGSQHTYSLMVPYDNDLLELIFRFETRPPVGVYSFSPRSGGNIINFDIYSNSSNFWSVVGSNILGPSTVDLTLTDSTDSLLAGSYFFVGQDGGNYSGEFSMDTTP